MEENENKNLNNLLSLEKKYRESGEHKECLDSCMKILNEIKLLSNNTKFEIISKLFLYQDQSNYVRIHLIHSLFQDNNFINSINLKRKYYQLLIDSFKNEKTNDLLKEKNDIIKLFEKSELNNFEEIDKYIVTLVSSPDSKTTEESKESKEKTEKTEKRKSLINGKKESFRRNKSLSNIFLTTSLSSSAKRLEPQENLLPQSSVSTSFENINTLRQSELNNSVQKIMNTYDQKKNEIKQILKKYKANSNLPLIIMSVSANLNKYQFLELIKNIFLKLNYKLICNVKDSEFENLNIYQYRPKNCCESIKYCLNKKYVKNEFQVLAILKSDENNFSRGVNTFLNDTYERKISIKSVRGNEQNIIQFFLNFLSKFCLSINKIKLIKQSKCLLKYNIEQSIQKLIQNKKEQIYKSLKFPKDILHSSQNSNYQKLIDDETYVEKTNSQANKYYELYKILSKGEYELGKSIKSFIDNFKKKYQPMTLLQIKSLDTKKLMIEVVKMLEMCTNTLNCTYNNNNQDSDITYLSLASEQFLFNKIYYLLYDIYDKKYSQQNEEYLQKIKQINEKCNVNDLFNKIGVKKKFRGSEPLPYKSVVDIINMVSLEKSLKKKFEILAQASLEIRTCVLEYTNGKYELDSMDDELPIIIYIATQVKVDNLFAELNIVDDYIKTILRDDLIQNKMVTNLLSSLMYISKSWNSETLTFENE